MTTVTGPGFATIPELEYHADTRLAPEMGRSLSVSGAKTILRTPALFEYQRRNRPAPKAAFDLGTLAHELILRSGDNRIRVIDCYDWRSNKDQDAKKAAHAEGLVPVNRSDLLEASRMAAAVRRHPLAAAILSEGDPEVSMFWVDDTTGLTLRGRIDWLRDNAIVDLKSANDASPDGFARDAAKFGYHMQAAWYSEGVEILTGKRLPFIFLVVEKNAPHLVGIYQMDDNALELGSAKTPPPARSMSNARAQMSGLGTACRSRPCLFRGGRHDAGVCGMWHDVQSLLIGRDVSQYCSDSLATSRPLTSSNATRPRQVVAPVDRDAASPGRQLGQRVAYWSGRQVEWTDRPERLLPLN